MSKAPVTDPLAKPVEAASFTPGPWEHDDRKPIMVDFHSAPYFSIGTFYKDAEEAKANARLIAASPDLFHALDCIVWCYSEDEFIPTEFWDMAKEAIKKARGA
jgi:hypothetical protein